MSKKKSNTITRKCLLASGIFLLAAIIAFGIYFYKTEQYQSWLPADGVITNIEQYSGSRRSNGSHRIYFAFTVDGIPYYGATLYSGQTTEYTIGEQVTVWYNPEDPSQLSNSSFHKPNAKMEFLVVFILAAPLIAVVLLQDTGISPLHRR